MQRSRLYTVRTAEELPVTGAKIAVKARLGLVVLAAVGTASVRERRSQGAGVLLLRAAAGLGALAVGVAVLWT